MLPLLLRIAGIVVGIAVIGGGAFAVAASLRPVNETGHSVGIAAIEAPGTPSTASSDPSPSASPSRSSASSGGTTTRRPSPSATTSTTPEPTDTPSATPDPTETGVTEVPGPTPTSVTTPGTDED